MGVLLVIVAIIVVLLVVRLLALGSRRSEERTLTFAEPVRRAEVELRAGAVAFAATDGPVRVHRTVRWALTRPVTSERVDDGVLRIEVTSPRPWVLGGEVSCRVEVPATVAVRGSTGAGAVGAEGTSGEVDLETQAGQVTLANLSGPVRALTQAGTVHGSGLASMAVEAATNAGTVSLAFDAAPDRVEARSNAGSVELLVPDERYAVNATSSAGQVEVDVANDPAAPRRLVARSGAGKVRVRRR